MELTSNSINDTEVKSDTQKVFQKCWKDAWIGRQMAGWLGGQKGRWTDKFIRVLGTKKEKSSFMTDG